MRRSQKVYLIFKRLIGLFGSIIGIIFCFALLWWWVFIINLIVTKGHPLYIQRRLGKHKKEFGLIKFRSMMIDAPEVSPNDITPEMAKSMETGFGRFLRISSIDETPQLFNILVGQMAFIGPRPGAAHNEEKLVKLRESFTPNAFEVKPGLGGLAQLMMNRDHNPELKAKYDSEYVQKISLWSDIKIFFGTIFGIFGKGKGS